MKCGGLSIIPIKALYMYKAKCGADSRYLIINCHLQEEWYIYFLYLSSKEQAYIFYVAQI